MEQAPTPLQPREFFAGRWEGEGELRPVRPLGWLIPAEQVRLESVTMPLSPVSWRVEERFAFSRSPAIDRVMLVEIVAPDRLRVSADDMPGGAEISLSAGGFTFSPYWIRARRFGLPFLRRCRDANSLEPDGIIHDRIDMALFGIPVATMELRVTRHPL